MDDIKWLAIFATTCFGALFGVLGYSEHLTHIEKMECMKQKGEYMKGVCVFR